MRIIGRVVEIKEVTDYKMANELLEDCSWSLRDIATTGKKIVYIMVRTESRDFA